MQFETNGYIYKTEKKGITVLQACLEVGISIPKFCFHERLTIAGNCRMCLVEVSANPRSKKPIASCALPLTNQMVIFTNTVLVKKARESVLELILINHPLDCPICDQGGECDLQDQSFIFGNDKSRFYETKRAVVDKFCGPFIKTIMTRCIHCTRCVRFANEIAGIDFFGITSRGASMEIGSYVEKIFNSELSGNVIDLCPVGALTSKTYAFVARPWELRSVENIDIFDTFGSRIRIDSRGLEILRILPSHNRLINEEWITDKIRFSYDGLMKQRLNIPMIKNIDNVLFSEISWVHAFAILFENFIYFYSQNFLKSNRKTFSFSAILGKFSDLGIIYVLKNFFNFFNPTNLNIFSQNSLINLNFDILNYFFLQNYLFIENKECDGFFLFLFNPRLELPLLNLKIRKNFLANSNFFLASFGYLTNLTYPFYDCGNKIFDFLNLLKGCHIICRKLIQLNNPFFFFGENFINLFEQSFKFIFNKFISISKFLKPLIKYSIFYNFKIIFSKCSLLNSVLFKFLNILNLKSSCLTFLFGTDEFLNILNKKLLLKKYYIYIGSHGNSDAEFSDMIFPSTTFVESVQFFINLEGRIQMTQYSIVSPIQSRENWRILYDFYVYLVKIIFVNKKNVSIFKKIFFNYDFFFISIFYTFMNLKNFFLLNDVFFDKSINSEVFLKKLICLFLNCMGTEIFNKFFIITYQFNFENLYCFNKLFLSSNISFYKDDVITRSSRFMNLAFLEFEINELNYF